MANTTDCPGTLNCPALPRVSLDQAVIDLLESIALQESALSHILCAESQKMKTALAMNEITRGRAGHSNVVGQLIVAIGDSSFLYKVYPILCPLPCSRYCFFSCAEIFSITLW